MDAARARPEGLGSEPSARNTVRKYLGSEWCPHSRLSPADTEGLWEKEALVSILLPLSWNQHERS